AIEKAEIVFLARPIALRERAQIRPEIAQVRVADARERRIRKGREIVRAVGATAFAHRAHEVGLRPFADAGLRMRRDVRPVESAERCLQRAPAGERHRLVLASLFRLGGVTADAAAGLGEIFAALGVALREAAGRKPQKEKPRESGAFFEHGGWTTSP